MINNIPLQSNLDLKSDKQSPLSVSSSWVNSNSKNAFHSRPEGSQVIPINPALPGEAANTTKEQEKDLASLPPLKLAEKYVDGFNDSDERYPELDQLIQQANLSNYMISPNLNDLGPLNPFERTGIVDIPDEVFEQYNRTQVHTQLGLLPEIERGYATIDSKIFFWKYTNNTDYYSFEAINHTILSVKLVKPKPQTFIDTVDYVLLVTTPYDIYILALSYKNGSLEIYDTEMIVSIRGISVDNIVASEKTGNIYFSGADGTNIWELQYSNSESWFRGKCGKVCRTRSSLSSLAPSGSLLSLIPGSSVVSAMFADEYPETILEMALDDSRQLLYTLSSKSTIRTYFISKDGSLSLCIEYSYPMVASHLQMINSLSPLLDAKKKVKIVHLHTISKAESNQIHLVAVTSTGCRLYIRAVRAMGFGSSAERSSLPPTAMQVVQVRFPPQLDNKVKAQESTALFGASNKSKIFSPGYFFAVINSREANNLLKTKSKSNSDNQYESDKLFISAVDSGSILNHQSLVQPIYLEEAIFLDLDGFIQEISIISPPFKASGKPLGYGNEFSAQYNSKATQIAVLTNTGIHFFTRKLPFEVFKSYGPDIRTYYELYGRTETCSTALYVACKSGNSEDEKEFARKVFLELGGKAHLKDDAYNLDERFPISFDSVRLSGRFYGIATYISRISRPLWNQLIFKKATQSKKPNVSEPIIESLQTKYTTIENLLVAVLEVGEFLEQNRPFIDGLSGPDHVIGMGSRGDEISLQAEHKALTSLVKLITSMREALSFLLLLSEEGSRVGPIVNNSNDSSTVPLTLKKKNDGLTGVMMYVPRESQKKLAELKFKDLFTSDSDNDLIKDLVSSIVNKNVSEGGSVDIVAKNLQERCGSFCSADDVIIFKAIEHLRKAKDLGTNDPDMKSRHLYNAVKLYQKTASTITDENFKFAIDSMIDLDYYVGAIELALAVASGIDRGNSALSYINDNSHTNGARSEIYKRRFNCYQTVFSILQIVDTKAIETVTQLEAAPVGDDASSRKVMQASKVRDETYQVAFNSNDELFHYSFYDWFVEQGVSDRLLEIESPFILSYLEDRSKSSISIADLLWVYHSKHENYFYAAQVLYSLSTSDFELTLSQRIEYLSRANGFCNCVCPPALRQQMSQLALMIQELVDVASIQDEILQNLTKDERFEDEEKRQEAVDALNGKILNVSVLFNNYADPLSYYEICLMIFKVSDFRGTDEIMRCWDKLIHSTHNNFNSKDSQDNYDRSFEAVSNVIQRLGRYFRTAEFAFPVDQLVPLFESFILEHDNGDACSVPPGLVVETFLNAGVPHDILYQVLNNLLEQREFPFDVDKNLKRLANDIVYLCERWWQDDKQIKLIVRTQDLRKLEKYLDGTHISNLIKRISR